VVSAIPLYMIVTANHTVTRDMTKVDEAVEAIDWDSFGLVVGDLSSAQTESNQFAKAYRMFERSRRLVVKLHNSVEESSRIPSRKFLLDACCAIEVALTRTTLVSQ
jgi:hypothetical protein